MRGNLSIERLTLTARNGTQKEDGVVFSSMVMNSSLPHSKLHKLTHLVSDSLTIHLEIGFQKGLLRLDKHLSYVENQYWYYRCHVYEKDWVANRTKSRECGTNSFSRCTRNSTCHNKMAKWVGQCQLSCCFVLSYMRQLLIWLISHEYENASIPWAFSAHPLPVLSFTTLLTAALHSSPPKR